MADGVHTVQRRRHGIGVTDVGTPVLGAGIEVVGLGPMSERQQHVEHDDVVSAADQRVDDM